MRLLNRTTRSVGLTAVGERLLARLKPVPRLAKRAPNPSTISATSHAGLRLHRAARRRESCFRRCSRHSGTLPDIRMGFGRCAPGSWPSFDAGIRQPAPRTRHGGVAHQRRHPAIRCCSPAHQKRHPGAPAAGFARAQLYTPAPADGATWPWEFRQKRKSLSKVPRSSTILSRLALAAMGSAP